MKQQSEPIPAALYARVSSERQDVDLSVAAHNQVETTDMNAEDFEPGIRDHRTRQERLEATVEEARSMLSERREVRTTWRR